MKKTLWSRYGRDVGNAPVAVPQSEFTYDALGNPTVYRGKTMTWTRGRNLAEYSGNTYDYNASGIRTTKIANGVQTTYYLDGNKIIAEERKYPNTSNIIDTVYYHYGVDGIAGFEYNGNNYTFRKNIQGDITHIYTADGELLVQYAYDAWGNCQAYAKKGYEELAERNPYRYRGYYYDTETKLYYLQSRYYDPEVGRFINADDISYLDPKTINSLNLYAYCCNNPVMLSDSTGCSPFWDAIGGWFKDHWKELVIGAAFIIVGAVVTALTAGTGVGFMAAFGSALLSSMTQVGISVAISAGIGALVGGITGGLEGALQGFGNGIASGFMWGGIFAGGAQILSGGFKAMAQLGANTSKSGSFLKVLTPNRLRSAGEVAKIAQKGQAYYEYGGTLLKVGKVFIDVSNKTFLHMHLFTAAHLPLGTVLAGILGGF